MAGKFLRHGALVDVKKSEERTNAKQKREGLTDHPVRFTTCGCPDPNCGGWHTILTDRRIPSLEECTEIIKQDNRDRKHGKGFRA